ncbi:hypothetical protein FRC12_024522 [Ceratobasidium sp. 428]|nr:hypothetical protein FRC12_024522 [Ceratobasidium sp. 428]
MGENGHARIGEDECDQAGLGDTAQTGAAREPVRPRIGEPARSTASMGEVGRGVGEPGRRMGDVGSFKGEFGWATNGEVVWIGSGDAGESGHASSGRDVIVRGEVTYSASDSMIRGPGSASSVDTPGSSTDGSGSPVAGLGLL